MISNIAVVLISLVLAIGHVWWGKQHPLKKLDELGNPVVVLASYHACWYHISIVFFATAVVSILDLAGTDISSQLFWLMLVIIFGCWVTYLGVLYHYPSMRKLGWGQVVLILILMVNLGVLANDA